MCIYTQNPRDLVAGMHTFLSVTLEGVIVHLYIVCEIIAFSNMTHTYKLSFTPSSCMERNFLT